MNNIKRNSPLMIIFYFVMIISLVLTSAYAWISLSNERTGYTDNLTIQDPPILYILDCDAKAFAHISLTGLKIGTPHKILFCVSNVFPVTDSNTNKSNNFSIQLAYTNNMLADFNLYPIEKISYTQTQNNDYTEYISQNGKSVYVKMGENKLISAEGAEDAENTKKGNELAYKEYPENYEQSNNVATYKIYNYNQKENKTLTYEEDTETNEKLNKKNCRYFILDISWSEKNKEKLGSVDAKETDLIYITAKGTASKDGGTNNE